MKLRSPFILLLALLTIFFQIALLAPPALAAGENLPNVVSFGLYIYNPTSNSIDTTIAIGSVTNTGNDGVTYNPPPWTPLSDVPYTFADNTAIGVQFAVNVITETYWTTNQACFHLKDAAGSPVNFSVIRCGTIFDGTNGNKNYIFIVPQGQLKPSTTYKITIDSGITANNGNSAGKEQEVGFTTTNDTVAPTWSDKSLTASNIGSTSLTLSWSGATDNVAVTGYKIYNDGNQIDTVTGGAVLTCNVTGLSPNTTYIFQLQAVDSSGNISTDGPTATAKTLADTSGGEGGTGGDNSVPVTINLNKHTAMAGDSVTVTGTSLADTWISIKIVDSVGQVLLIDAVKSDQGGSYSYTFTVPDMGEGNLTVIAGYGTNVASAVLSTTDTQAPTWPDNSELAASQVTMDSLSLSWNSASDDVGVAGYKVYQGTALLTSTPVTGTSYNVSGLTAGTDYTFTIQAVDEVGNESTTGPSVTVTTATPPDTTAPDWISGTLTPSEVTQTGLTLNWSGATDNVGVAGYKVYQGTTLLTSTPVTGTSYNVSVLTAGTDYTFTIQAVDAAGNESTTGPSVTVTTTTPPDTAAPDWTSGTLTSSEVTQTGLTLTWSGATDNVGVTGYKVYQNGSLLTATPVTGTSYDVTGLNPGTQYNFKVQAGDAAGNWSTNGPATSAITTVPRSDKVQLSLPETVGKPGQSLNLPVTISDGEGTAAFEFTLNYDPALLSNIQINKGSLIAEDTNWTVESTVYADHIKVVAYNVKTQGLTNGAGELLTLTFTIGNNDKSGDELDLILGSLLVTDALGEGIPAVASNGKVTVVTRNKGDVNGDTTINVMDVVITLNISLEKIQPTFEESYAADANNDGQVNVLDVVRIVNIILDIDPPPILSAVTTGTVTIGENVTATSNEDGFLYLVPEATAANQAAIDAAGTASNGIKVAATATVSANLSTTGFAAGTYVVYAIDAAGNVSTPSAAITLSAPNVTTYTVTFNSNGGSAIAPITNVTAGATVTLPAAPTREGFTFDGWFTDNTTFANAFTEATAVTADVTVYAKWTAAAAYGYVCGYVYDNQPTTSQTVIVGSDVVFNSNGSLQGVAHNAGASTITVNEAGIYNITFGINSSGNNPQSWGIAVNGTVQSNFNCAGQTMVQSAQLPLNAGDVVSIRNVATGTGSPATATLRTNCNAAWVQIDKVESAYGYVYDNQTTTGQSIAVGSDVVFNSNGPLQGVGHDAGTSTITVNEAGIYNITFGICTNANNPESWGIAVNGTVQSLFTCAGQTIVESAQLSLNAGDVVSIRNVATNPTPAILRLNCNAAWVQIDKVESAYGYVYDNQTTTGQSIAVGSDVLFNSNGPLQGVGHDAGTSTITANDAGVYNITFGICTNSNNPQSWGIAVNGTVQSSFICAGQTMVESAQLSLNAGDVVSIRNVATNPNPAGLRLNCNAAWVQIYKVDN
ncbi:MAG: Exoglucanase B precursor [Pelotomaculum sp. PtaB.Bin104]|nr:MAG: Exoglucanase B precursor [Pelotomaculum sp. PtaB.Bin104]